MRNQRRNNAYIDAANLYKGNKSLGWRLDYRKFRRWLQEKHGVETAYLFMGYVPGLQHLYKTLRASGYVLVFKETVHDGQGNIKGNCDADLALWTVSDFYEGKYDQSLIVSSDGDYTGLVRFLIKRGKFKAIVSPAPIFKCSCLLKHTGAHITFLGDIRSHVEVAKNERAPDADGTA
jgi:uncharacterized LabA/DUF88 family protein